MRKRVIELDIVRVIAMLLVVIGHCGYLSIVTKWGGVDYTNSFSQPLPCIFTVIITRMTSVIYAFHMELFMALSGVLFDKDKYNTFGDLVKEKARKLIVPYLLVMFLYDVPIKIFTGYYKESEKPLHDIIVGQFFLQGNSYLWFLPTLFCIGVISYCLKDIPKEIRLGVGIALFLLSALPSIKLISAIATYYIWFEFGVFCRSYIQKEHKDQNKLGTALLFIALFFSLYVYRGIVNDKLGLLWKAQTLILNLFVPLPAIIAVYLISKRLRESGITKSHVFETLREKSFDIYLFSDPLNYLFLFILFSIPGSVSVVSTEVGFACYYFIRFIITTFGAVAISSMLKLVKGKRN